MTQELQVIQDYYTFSLLFLRRVRAFPRDLRHGWGRSIEFRLEVVLSLLIRAKYAQRADKEPLLRDLNVELEILRFQLRQATDLKAVSLAQQLTLLEQLESIGQQVGGWLKSLTGPQNGGSNRKP